MLALRRRTAPRISGRIRNGCRSGCGGPSMKARLLAMSWLTLLSSGVSAADFTDEAQVIAATPIYATVNEPTRDCWSETGTSNGYAETAPPTRSYAGAALGGVTGG